MGEKDYAELCLKESEPNSLPPRNNASLPGMLLDLTLQELDLSFMICPAL